MSRRRGMRCEGGARVRVRQWLPIVMLSATALVLAAVPPVLNDTLAGRQVFSPANWWNLDITRRAGRCAILPDHRLHQRAYGNEQDARSTSSSRLRSSSLRDTLRCRRRRSAAGDARARRLRRRERYGRARVTRLSDPGRSADDRELHRRRRGRRWRVWGSTHARGRPRSMAALRDLRNPLERGAGDSGKPIPRPCSTCHGAIDGRMAGRPPMRRGWQSFPAWCDTTRCSVLRRSPTPFA